MTGGFFGVKSTSSRLIAITQKPTTAARFRMCLKWPNSECQCDEWVIAIGVGRTVLGLCLSKTTSPALNWAVGGLACADKLMVRLIAMLVQPVRAAMIDIATVRILTLGEIFIKILRVGMKWFMTT